VPSSHLVWYISEADSQSTRTSSTTQ